MTTRRHDGASPSQCRIRYVFRPMMMPSGATSGHSSKCPMIPLEESLPASKQPPISRVTQPGFTKSSLQRFRIPRRRRLSTTSCDWCPNGTRVMAEGLTSSPGSSPHRWDGGNLTASRTSPKPRCHCSKRGFARSFRPSLAWTVAGEIFWLVRSAAPERPSHQMAAEPPMESPW